MIWFVIPIVVIVVVLITFVVFGLLSNLKDDKDPQDMVGVVCTLQNNVGTEIDHVLVLQPDHTYKVLRMSTYKGKIESHAQVLIVKYEPDFDSYKVERYN